MSFLVQLPDFAVIGSEAATVAALKLSLPRHGADTRVLAGRATAYDGGEGQFVWTTDTTTANDDIMVVVPTNFPGGVRTGCWKRVFQGAIDAAWFGCQADYDGASGTDNSGAIQAAFNYLNTRGGGRLVFKAPATGLKYRHNSTIDLTQMTNIEVEGMATQGGDVGKGPVFSYTGPTASTNKAWIMPSANGLSFSRVYFSCAANFQGVVVSLDTTLSGDTSRIYFDRCAFGAGSGSNTPSYAVSLDRAVVVHFKHCDFRGCTTAIRGKKFNLVSSYAVNVILDGCTFPNEGCTEGWIENPDEGWDIRGCNFGGRVDGAMSLIYAPWGSHGGNFSGNWIGDMSQPGANAVIRGQLKGWSFSGNTLYGQGATDFMQLTTGSEGVCIRGNAFKHWNTILTLDAAMPGLDFGPNSYEFVVAKLAGFPAYGNADRNIVNQFLYHEWCARAVQTTPQSIPAGGSPTTVVFQTATHNTGSILNTATGVFTAPVTGIYAVSTMVRLVLTSGYMYAGLYKNGTRYALGTVSPGNATSEQATSIISTLVRMDAGNTLDVRVFQDSAGATDTLCPDATQGSYISIDFIHNQG